MKKTIAILLVMLSHNAYAITGNELYALITSNDPSEYLEGMRFIQGSSGAESYFHYLEGILSAEEKRSPDLLRYACVPSNVTNGQAVDVVKKYLQDNPSKRNFDASQLTHFALIQAWPCTK